MLNDNKIDPNELVQLLQKIITRVESLEKDIEYLNNRLDKTIIDFNLLKKDVSDNKKNIVNYSTNKNASTYPVSNSNLEQRIAYLESQLLIIKNSVY